MRLTLVLLAGLAFGSNMLRAGQIPIQIFSNYGPLDPYDTTSYLNLQPSVGAPFLVPSPTQDGFEYALSDFTFVAQLANATLPIDAALYATDSVADINSSTGYDYLPTGPAIESWSGITLGTTATETTVDSVLDPVLTSGQVYMIVLTDPTYDPTVGATNQVGWYFDGDGSSGDAFYNLDSGWSYNPGYSTGALQVDATLEPTATPEPGTFLAIGGGLLLLGAARRKKLNV